MDTFTTEQALRQEAIRRRLEGERRCDICESLERSVRWFSKWWAEYQHDPDIAFQDRARTPHTSPTQLPACVEQAVVNVRLTLQGAVYGLIGPAAIQQELKRRQVKPLPSLSSIERVLRKHGLSSAQGSATHPAYYPELIAWAPNAIHATDIITRHLYGGQVVQNFHTFDHYSHAVHLSQTADKSSLTATAHLLENWGELGLPAVQQLDNENAFSGGHSHARVIGRVVRLCLFAGIEVLFNPEYEPERNYWVEGFHSLWLKAFWSRRTFANLARVQRAVRLFEDWYQQRYQPPSLQGRTPAQMRRGFQPVRLNRAMRCQLAEALPITEGRIHFMRKVTTDGTIRLLNESWPVGCHWINTYVRATLSTRQQTLGIWHKPDADASWQLLKQRAFKLAEPVQPLLPIFRRKCARCLDYWPA